MAQKFFNIFSNPFTFCQIQLKSELFKIETFQTFFYNFFFEIFIILSKFSWRFLKMSDKFLIFKIDFHRIYFPIFRNNFKMRNYGEILRIIYGWSSLRWSILALYCVSKNFAARCEMPRDTARSLSKNSRLEFLEFQKFLPGWSFIITFYGFCFWSLSLFVVHPYFSVFLEFLKILKNSRKWEFSCRLLEEFGSAEFWIFFGLVLNNQIFRDRNVDSKTTLSEFSVLDFRS